MFLNHIWSRRNQLFDNVAVSFVVVLGWMSCVAATTSGLQWSTEDSVVFQVSTRPARRQHKWPLNVEIDETPVTSESSATAVVIDPAVASSNSQVERSIETIRIKLLPKDSSSKSETELEEAPTRTSFPRSSKKAAECNTKFGNPGDCLLFKHCYPLLFTKSGDLRNAGLAEVLYQSSGKCQSAHNDSQIFDDVPLSFYDPDDDSRKRSITKFFEHMICCDKRNAMDDKVGQENKISHQEVTIENHTVRKEVKGINNKIPIIDPVELSYKRLQNAKKKKVNKSNGIPRPVFHQKEKPPLKSPGAHNKGNKSPKVSQIKSNPPSSRKHTKHQKFVKTKYYEYSSPWLDQAHMPPPRAPLVTQQRPAPYVQFHEEIRQHRLPSNSSSYRPRVPFRKAESPRNSGGPSHQPYNPSAWQCPGRNVVMPRGHWPWLVALLKDGNHFCSATLIDNLHILTAAHCIYDLSAQDVGNIRALIGDRVMYSTIDGPHLWRRIVRITRHLQYNHRTLHNDIAILALDSPVEYAHSIQPINLPVTSNRNHAAKGIVLGWSGVDLAKPFHEPRSPQEAIVEFMDLKQCQKRYDGFVNGISNDLICTYPSNSSCKADSGGPLLIKTHNCWHIVGIVSWSLGCGSFPEVYTDVAKHAGWIQKNLNPYNHQPSFRDYHYR